MCAYDIHVWMSCVHVYKHACVYYHSIAVCIRDACICACAVHYVRTVHGMCLSNA